MFTIIFIGLALVCAVLEYTSKDQNTASHPVSSQFRSFQRNYLTVYLMAMAGDWLQGPYIYALYESFGYEKSDIAFLFVVGFVSSMVLGTVIGAVADTLGRRRMALAFVVIYSASCLTKLSRDFWVLFLGRLLSGIATSLLFTVFEAWMVHEHQERKFAPEELGNTFARATFGNGLVAVGAGLLASWLAGSIDLVAPHMAAVVLFICVGIVIWSTWNENYGNHGGAPWFASLKPALNVVLTNPSVLGVGTIQALFEGAMYTFVFMWTPALAELTTNQAAPPLGIIFASFMLCIMIGSGIFGRLSASLDPVQLTQTNLALATAAFVLAAFSSNDVAMYASFLVFEVCCGLYFPTQGVLRGMIVPEETRATVMNLFRVPLNLLVVVVLLKVSQFSSSTIFFMCASWVATAFVIARFMRLPSQSSLPSIN